jgi:hypothetical protein
MSSQDCIPQALTTRKACFALNQHDAAQAKFWRHQERLARIAAAAPGFVSVIGRHNHATRTWPMRVSRFRRGRAGHSIRLRADGARADLVHLP